ncbi:phage portal protein [Salmonella enterica]|uniref:phage portal protein n=1 Tax=Salmonella enterica TaxID=28901 RepID=UPI0013B3EEC7|nr:phage portal protein [Salmonella enterica]
MAICRQIGAALELPYELLVKHFTASYSASRAALLEARKMFRMRREWMVLSFCQPIYEEWLSEAVAKGRVIAPGFLWPEYKAARVALSGMAHLRDSSIL